MRPVEIVVHAVERNGRPVAFRSFGLRDLIDTYLPRANVQRGFSEAQTIESVALLQTIGDGP